MKKRPELCEKCKASFNASADDHRSQIEADRERMRTAKPSRIFPDFKIGELFDRARKHHGNDPFFLEVCFYDDGTFYWKAMHSRSNGAVTMRTGISGHGNDPHVFSIEVDEVPSCRE